MQLDSDGNIIDINGKPISDTASRASIGSILSQLALLRGDVDTSHVWRDKTACFYGDSLTEENFQYTKGYHKWVQEILGLASYENYGISGYKLSDIYDKINSTTTTADIIIVMGGVNDENFSTPLGQMGDTTTSTIYGSLDKVCSLLRSKYPTKICLLITPHYQTNYPSSLGITSYEISKAMLEVAYKYAIPVYDNYKFSEIYTTNLTDFTNDRCHWNDKTHERVGKNLAKFIYNNFRCIPNYEDGTGTLNIVLSKSSISMLHNKTNTFTVCLDKDPGKAVSLSINLSNSNITVSPTTLSFDSSNYSTPKTVTVTGTTVGSSTVTISGTEVISKTVAVEVESETYGGIVLSKSAIAVEQTKTDTFTVKLDKAPTYNQTVTLSVNNSNCTLSKTSLTFTPSNYSTAQSITVTGSTIGSSTITISSSGVASKTVSITIAAQKVSVTGVSISGATSLEITNQITLTATISPSNATNKSVSWTRNNSNVTLIPEGLTCKVTGAGIGSSIITATTDDGSYNDSHTVTVSAHNYANKTFTATASKISGLVHLCAVIKGNLKSSDVVGLTYSLKSGSNFITGAAPSAQLFTADSYELNNSEYTGTCSAQTYVGTTWTDGSCSGTANYTVNAAVSSGYVKIPLPLYPSGLPASCVISSIKVVVNGTEVPILNLGTFFTEETYTLQ